MSRGSYLEQVASGLKKLFVPVPDTLTSIASEVIFLILDRSGSMAVRCGRVDRLDAAKQASLEMIKAREQIGADDRVAIITFNDKAELVLPLTRYASNRDKIERAIRLIRIGGGTDLSRPLELVNRSLPPEGQVHVVMLSDGQGGDPIEMADALKSKGVVIETIGVGNKRAEVDESTLKKTASNLDGKILYRFLKDSDEIMHYFRTDIAYRLVKRG